MLIKVLEFDLPSGGGGLPAQMARYKILQKFKELENSHRLIYKCKTVGYRLDVWYEKESDYTLFFLLYDSKGDWRKFRYVEKEINGE